MRSKISTIFFDFDGVLTTHKSGSYTTCLNIQRAVPHIAFDSILHCYRQHHAHLLVGQTTHQAVWASFCECIGVSLDISVLNKAFQDTPMNTQVLTLCQQFHSTYRLGVITDNSAERFEVVKQVMELTRLFDIFIVSGDLGSRKDSVANFKQALTLANAAAHECVFIDNNPSNLVIPAQLGFHTIFHDDAQNDVEGLKQTLTRYGVVL
ncbi:MAG: HAD family hydrolase [Chloroflexota bacterium]